jgi:hypothetical protein
MEILQLVWLNPNWPWPCNYQNHVKFFHFVLIFFVIFLLLTITSCEFLLICVFYCRKTSSHFPFYFSLLWLSQFWNEVNDLSVIIFLHIVLMPPPPTALGHSRSFWFYL